MVLRREGYDIIEAADGSEALRQANTQHPDLILMDLGLPVMNGDEVTARIKKDPWYCSYSDRCKYRLRPKRAYR